MTTQDKRKTRAARTETVSVRLDPKLRYLADLAARKQRRTLSSYIEWAVERSLSEVLLYEGRNHNENISVEEAAGGLWDVDDSERFVRLAISYAELLTHEEQQKWKMLLDSRLLEPAKRRDSGGDTWWDRPTLEDKVYPVLRQRWPALVAACQVGAGAMREWTYGTRAEVESGVVYPMTTPPVQKTGFDADDDIQF